MFCQHHASCRLTLSCWIVLGTWEFRSSTLLKIWPGFHLLAQQLYCWSYLLRTLDLVFVPRDQRSVHLSILYWNSISIHLILATLMIRFRSFSDNIDVIRFFKKIILSINHIKINCYIVKKNNVLCTLNPCSKTKIILFIICLCINVYLVSILLL